MRVDNAISAFEALDVNPKEHQGKHSVKTHKFREGNMLFFPLNTDTTKATADGQKTPRAPSTP
ncbi:hypothetical protein [Legionella sp. W05-934-2]|uniref:hypothetical protein n=1 Tax=Legionella sp. W05-934-2 TaxID=1198649 RepID=UPI0034629335